MFYSQLPPMVLIDRLPSKRQPFTDIQLPSSDEHNMPSTRADPSWMVLNVSSCFPGLKGATRLDLQGRVHCLSSKAPQYEECR